MKRKRRKNWREFFEKNRHTKEFSMYRIKRNLPYPAKHYDRKAFIRLKHNLQTRYGITIY